MREYQGPYPMKSWKALQEGAIKLIPEGSVGRKALTGKEQGIPGNSRKV